MVSINKEESAKKARNDIRKLAKLLANNQSIDMNKGVAKNFIKMSYERGINHETN